MTPNVKQMLPNMMSKYFMSDSFKKKEKLQIKDSQLSFAREERLELPTLGFGDRCSTN